MIKLILKISFLFVSLILLTFQGSTNFDQRIQLEPTQKQDVIQSLNSLPLYFIENKGQVHERVKYHCKIPHGNVHFSSEEIVYQFIHVKDEEGSHEERLMQNRKERTDGIKVKNILVRFIGSNDEHKIEGLDENEAKVSYFRGKDPQKWVKGARTYHKVIYRNLYPQIDLVIYGSKEKIKHEYRVRVGGDPENIEVRYERIQKLRTNEKGQLEIETSDGLLIEDVPLSYQIIDGKSVEVETKYVVNKNNTLKFNVREYRKDKELIIDPALLYSTYLGGSGGDFGDEIAVDENGNAYVTGTTPSSDFPTTSGAFDTRFNSPFDAFITKLNSTGTNLLYSTYLGGGRDDGGAGISVDENGNAYIIGYTRSPNFPTTLGAYDNSHNGTYDAFITKLNSTGTDLLYSSFLGGSYDEIGTGIAVDENGSAFITGRTWSSDFPTTPGAYDNSFNGGNYDAFVTKLNSSGTGLIYSTLLGGISLDPSMGITADENGNAYIIGYTSSNDFPTTPGAYDTSHNGSFDAFITKFNSSGTNLIYSTYLGGSDSDIGYDIEIDGSRNFYVTGYTTSKDFPTSSDSYDTGHNGGYDAFITKLNSTGTSLLYSTYLGGSGDDSSKGIAIDGSGNVYITGYTESRDFPTTSGVFDRTYNGGKRDVFVSKINSGGTGLLYSSYLGGSDDEWNGYDIEIDESGNAYIIGQTYSSDFPTTPDAFDTSFNGGPDVFLTKIKITQYQGSISGKITDSKTGIPVAKARVKIVNKSKKHIKKSAKTDINGYYIINIKKFGTYKMNVRKKGYRPYKNNKVEISGHVVLDLELKKK